MPTYHVTIGGQTYEVSSDRELSDAEAHQFASQSPEYASNQPGMLRKGWDWLTSPLTTAPSRVAGSLADKMDAPSLDTSPGMAQLKGFLAGATQGAGDLASDMTSPLNLGLSLAGPASEAVAPALRAGKRGVQAVEALSETPAMKGLSAGVEELPFVGKFVKAKRVYSKVRDAAKAATSEALPEEVLTGADQYRHGGTPRTVERPGRAPSYPEVANSVPTGGPAPRVAGKAPQLEDTLNSIVEGLRGPEPVSSTSLPPSEAPLTRGGRPAISSEPSFDPRAARHGVDEAPGYATSPEPPASLRGLSDADVEAFQMPEGFSFEGESTGVPGEFPTPPSATGPSGVSIQHQHDYPTILNRAEQMFNETQAMADQSPELRAVLDKIHSEPRPTTSNPVLTPAESPVPASLQGLDEPTFTDWASGMDDIINQATPEDLAEFPAPTGMGRSRLNRTLSDWITSRGPAATELR